MSHISGFISALFKVWVIIFYSHNVHSTLFWCILCFIKSNDSHLQPIYESKTKNQSTNPQITYTQILPSNYDHHSQQVPLSAERTWTASIFLWICDRPVFVVGTRDEIVIGNSALLFLLRSLERTDEIFLLINHFWYISLSLNWQTNWQ